MATITVRTDSPVEEALAQLTADGTSTSDAVRNAILETARRRYYDRMQAEAEIIAADEQDRAEVRAIRAEMEGLGAW
jgi:Arc/MetJ-type ribon-helix-helix transcriptional regulator